MSRQWLHFVTWMSGPVAGGTVPRTRAFPDVILARVRFNAFDLGEGSIVEAGVDAVTVRLSSCDDGSCEADLDGSGVVDFTDLVDVLSFWGPCPGCPQDLDDSGVVDFDDLVTILAAWGPCS